LRQHDTKQALLDGARACLARKGFASTTARDIAAASGANLRSIGYHYGSVKRLLTAALSENFRTWLAPLITADEGHLASIERLQEGLRLFSEQLPANGPLVRAWLEAVAMAQDDPELHQILTQNQSWFREALARTLVDAGSSEPERQAAAIITTCDGLMVRYLLHGTIPTVTEIAHEAHAALDQL
jgi:AcrR family transcriptional regulator